MIDYSQSITYTLNSSNVLVVAPVVSFGEAIIVAVYFVLFSLVCLGLILELADNV